MKLTINGLRQEIRSSNIIDLLDELDLKKEKMVIEINKKIIEKEKFNETNIKENDSIEIITLVGGG
jgi:sulfur carrier protein|tara:strand:+ start:148 stop:345 length:198 start_codon:yes stop_codon:yes gene_type:complete